MQELIINYCGATVDGCSAGVGARLEAFGEARPLLQPGGMVLPRDVVAVMNTSEDTTDLLRIVLEQAGFVVVTAFTNRLRDGKTDFEAFLRQHRPKVIVYDIGMPYEQNWALFQHFRSQPACAGVQFVLTTPNSVQVAKIAGAEQHVHEIVGKPYDLDVVVRAVKDAARQRPTA